jgi:SNF2 family DNA or RNA helicase
VGTTCVVTWAIQACGWSQQALPAPVIGDAVQNDLTELYNLLTLLKPGIFKTLKEFKAAYMTPGKPRQPANPERLRELMRSAMIRNTRAVVALKLPRRHAATIRVDGVAGEREAYLELAAAARRTIEYFGTQNGGDLYKVAFQNGATIWAIRMSREARLRD